MNNPLFVVKKNGKVVEEANGFFDMILKKLRLDEFLEIILKIFNDVMDFLVGLSQVDKLKEYLDQFVKFFQFIEAKMEGRI